MAGLNTLPVLDALVSHASRSGMFDRVNTHEPKSAPNNGVTCAIYVGPIRPAPLDSGLRATTARVEYQCRLYTNMLSSTPDLIDPNMQMAADALFTALAADYTLGGTVKQIDLHGRAGEPLRSDPGYISQDGTLLRVITIFVPTIINDAWPQETT